MSDVDTSDIPEAGEEFFKNARLVRPRPTREQLLDFELDIAGEFNSGFIRAPIHLDGGNEDKLIDIFAAVRAQDFVCCSWRSHYKALLHGIPPAKVKAAIMAGRSIALCFPEHRFFSSAIVGGNLPIALGLAWSIKRAGGSEKVWAFSGDMAARGGMFAECSSYALGHSLPITFVVEDNGKSVCTDTSETWRRGPLTAHGPNIVYYRYTLPWPHSGAGDRVEF